MAVALVGGLVWVGLRPARQPAQPIPVPPNGPATSAQSAATAPTTTAPARPSPAARPATAASSNLPLTSPEPTEPQLKGLLSTWLDAKSAVLAGQPAAEPLTDLARPLLISKLEQQQQENRSRNEIEAINATVLSLQIRERSPRRISAAVTLTYSDERRTSSGSVLSQTPASELRNIYVFARDGETWHVAAYRPGS